MSNPAPRSESAVTNATEQAYGRGLRQGSIGYGKSSHSSYSLRSCASTPRCKPQIPEIFKATVNSSGKWHKCYVEKLHGTELLSFTHWLQWGLSYCWKTRIWSYALLSLGCNLRGKVGDWTLLFRNPALRLWFYSRAEVAMFAAPTLPVCISF